MRKRSMSLFQEPVHDDDDELSSSGSSADEADDFADAEKPIPAGQPNGGNGASPADAPNDASGLWTKDESRELVRMIEAQLPDGDKHSYARRIKTLDWPNIQLPGHSTQQCKEQLMALLKKIRHMRTLAEVLGDVHDAIEKPPKRKVVSAYRLFCDDYRKTATGQSFKEWGMAFRELSPASRKRYEDKATSNRVPRDKRAKLHRELAKMASTPFVLFCREQLDAVDGAECSRQLLRQRFAKLPDDEQAVYVRQAVDRAKADGVDMLTVLTNKEIKLLRTGTTAPKVMTGYNLFVRDFYANKLNQTANLGDASRMYGMLSAGEKAEYKQRAKEQAQSAAVARDVKSPKAETTPGKKKLVQLSLSFDAHRKPSARAVQATAADGATEDAVDGASDCLGPPAAVGSARKRRSKPDADESVLLSPNGSRRQSIKVESCSESDTPARKRRLKVDSARKRLIEPAKVPTSVFQYFAERVFEGKPKKAKKAYEKLPPADLKKIKRDAKKCMAEYMDSLETYLKSLSKEELVEYSNRSREIVPNNSVDDDFLASSSANDDI